MLKIFRRGAFAALPALLVLGACNESIDGVDDQEAAQVNEDVAAAMASATGDDIAVMTTASAEVTDDGEKVQRECPRNGFRFRCAKRRFGDLEFSREVTYFDENGDPMDALDPLLTASIHILSSMEGSHAKTGMSLDVSRERDLTVTGLLGEEKERTWNGTGSSQVNRTRVDDENGSREYDMSASTTIEDVVIAVPREGTWPLSGKIIRDVTVEVVIGLDDVRTRERHVEVEFNGTQFVPMTVNGEEYTLDLETRRPVKDAT